MSGCPQFSFLISIALAKICFSHTVVNTWVLVGTVLNARKLELSASLPRSLLFWPIMQFFLVSLGRKDCVMSQKSICKGGYLFAQFRIVLLYIDTALIFFHFTTQYIYKTAWYWFGFLMSLCTLGHLYSCHLSSQ